MKSLLQYLIESKGQRIRDRKTNRPYNLDDDINDKKQDLQDRSSILRQMHKDFNYIHERNECYTKSITFAKELYKEYNEYINGVYIIYECSDHIENRGYSNYIPSYYLDENGNDHYCKETENYFEEETICKHMFKMAWDSGVIDTNDKDAYFDLKLPAQIGNDDYGLYLPNGEGFDYNKKSDNYEKCIILISTYKDQPYELSETLNKIISTAKDFESEVYDTSYHSAIYNKIKDEFNSSPTGGIKIEFNYNIDPNTLLNKIKNCLSNF